MTRFLLVLAISTVSALCASPPAPAPTPPDAVIENTIKTKLARSKIAVNNFKFRVQNGVVYWEGTTDVVQHKGSATRMAKASGAKRVVNNIRTSEAARAKARAHLNSSRRIIHSSPSESRTEPRSAPRAAVIRR